MKPRSHPARAAAFSAFIAIGLLLLGACAAPRRISSSGALTAEDASEVSPLALIQEAADHEALFTLAGGLKPMSTGIWQGSFEVLAADTTQLEATRAALAPLRNELWYADVQVFAAPHEGKRMIHAFVVHRAALRTMIERFQNFWAPWGIVPSTHPVEVLLVVDRMPTGERWRGYGYLFGFPADAVDFFVAAGMAAKEGGEVGPGKDRQFIHIPTRRAETGRFTYAAPLGHVPTGADLALREQAAAILAAYEEVRDDAESAQELAGILRRLNDRFAAPSARASAIRDRTGSPALSTVGHSGSN